MNPTLELTTSGKTILRVDASHYSQSNCRRFSWWQLVMGLRQPGKDHKMEYGTAFHKGLQSYYTNHDENQALEIAVNHYTQPSVSVPDSDWRTASHLADALAQYFKEWRGENLHPQVVNGVPLLEQRFAFPLLSTPRTEVLLCGTIDMLGSYGGHNVVVDHKTTALTDVDSYLDSYMLSPQLMIYTWVHQRLFPRMGEINAMINGIFLNRQGKNKFKRSPLLRFSPAKLRDLDDGLVDWGRDLATKWEIWQDTNVNTFRPNFTCCERKYGMCQYTPLCRLDSEDHQATIAALSYIQQTYNPLKFQD